MLFTTDEAPYGERVALGGSAKEAPPSGFSWLYCMRLSGNKCYVGVTRHSIEHRYRGHRKSTSLCPRLRDALKSREDSDVELFRTGLFHNDIVGEAERSAIREFNTLHPGGYNLTTGGESYSLTPDSVAKMTRAHKGKPLSEEHKNKLRVAHLGRVLGPLPAHVREKISASNLGKRRSQAVRDAMSASRRGLPMKEATKKKISDALVGVKKSPEHAQAIARARWPDRFT